MKKILIIFVLPVLITCVIACKKHTSASPATLIIPFDLDSLMPTNASMLNGITYPNVSGLLIACKVAGELIDTAGDTNYYSRNWEAAQFTGSAGSVMVNTAGLLSTSDLICSHHDTTATWNESSTNHWAVTGSGSIPAFSADVSGTYPGFSGTLPANISRSSDYSFTFNSGNTVNGDSAYMVIYCAGSIYKSNVVSANGGTAVITSYYLSHTRNAGISLSFSYAGLVAPVYYGGYIDFVIYNHTVQTFGGKQFAFIKQRQYLGIVQFL